MPASPVDHAMKMLSTALAGRLRRPAGYTWKQILIAAALGLFAGLFLALTISLPAS
jgi:hypothetical protein